MPNYRIRWQPQKTLLLRTSIGTGFFALSLPGLFQPPVMGVTGNLNDPIKNKTLSAGVKNLFDRAPPFSNQNQANQTGYDPSYTDPHGRLYWAEIKYVFK